MLSNLVLRADEEIHVIQEEIHVIQEEMKATFSFYLLDWKRLLETIQEYSTKSYSPYNNGALAYARLKCHST